MATLKVRISSGHTQTLREIELLEVDGVPYNGCSESDLSSRVSILEHVVADLLTKLESKDDNHDD